MVTGTTIITMRRYKNYTCIVSTQAALLEHIPIVHQRFLDGAIAQGSCVGARSKMDSSMFKRDSPAVTKSSSSLG